MATKMKFQDISSEEEQQAEGETGRPAGKTFTTQQQQQRKFPTQHRSEIEQLIDQNATDQIVLNIVKCHFDATVENIKSTFSDFTFADIQNYNKGSFSLVFDSKDEAKRFVEATRNQKILERNFWVKFPVNHQKGGEQHTSEHPRFHTSGGDNADRPFQRGGGVQTGGPDNRNNENRAQRGPRPNQQQQQHQHPKKKEEDDGWQTVGMNQKPIDLRPKRHYHKNNNQPRHQKPQ